MTFRQRLQCVTFIFMPRHAGIKSKDRADSPARSASVVNRKAVDCVHILKAIRDTCRDECPGGS